MGNAKGGFFRKNRTFVEGRGPEWGSSVPYHPLILVQVSESAEQKVRANEVFRLLADRGLSRRGRLRRS